MDKPPYLTLVDPGRDTSRDEEFTPLPFYPWDQRPDSLELDADECATAIHLGGDLPQAANLLKVPLVRLNRLVRHSPRLQRVLAEATELLVHRAAGEYARALDAQDDRRREWGASKIMASRAAQSHPLSPAPANAAASSVTINQQNREIVFSWREPAAPVILDHADQGRNGSDD